MMRVLLVAPHMADLPGAAMETYAIDHTPGLDVHRLPPDVRRRDIIDALLSGQYDVLWIASHGTAQGVDFGGDFLPTSDLVPYIKSAEIPYVVLNTCESEEIAEDIHDATGADVICTVSQVPDLQAYQTAALLAGHLGRTGDFRTAYELSKPGGREHVYRYVPEYRRVLMAPNQFQHEELRAIYEAINALSTRMSVVETELRYMKDAFADDRHNRYVPLAVWLITLGCALATLIAMFVFFMAR